MCNVVIQICQFDEKNLSILDILKEPREDQIKCVWRLQKDIDGRDLNENVLFDKNEWRRIICNTPTYKLGSGMLIKYSQGYAKPSVN